MVKTILVHGLGQKAADWEKTKNCLKNGAEDVICPDLYALAESEKLDYEVLYGAFSSYCDHIEVPFRLCGLSLGAVLSLNYALDHPDKIESLVLIAPQYKMPRLLLALQNVLFCLMPKTVFNKMGLTKDAFIGICNSMSKLDFSKVLPWLACKTMVICGEKDHANLKAAREISMALPTAQLCLVPDAGHELNTDVPEKLAEILNKYWNGGD